MHAALSVKGNDNNNYMSMHAINWSCLEFWLHNFSGTHEHQDALTWEMKNFYLRQGDLDSPVNSILSLCF